MTNPIQHNAALVQQIAREHFQAEIDFDRSGVEWLDAYIMRQHEKGDPAQFDALTSTLGSFFGECIIRTYGGEWAEDQYGLAVRFDESNAVYPFAKVAKQLEDGAEESVLSMFDTIPVVFKSVLGE